MKNARRWVPLGPMLLCLASGWLCAASPSPPAEGKPPALSWHRGLFRVNSDISSGTEGVETIARKAEAEGMAFVVFTDQFLVRAEYGLPPFRRVARVSREQDSVVRYGIDAYLGRLNRLQLEHPGLVVIPGVDVAPALWWTGNPVRGTLTAHQFSEQMTIFGPQDAAFYRDLPVIFNTRPGWRFPGTLIALLPLLLAVLGWRLIRTPPRAYYEDCQGNRYTGPRWPRYLLGGVPLVVGILWTIDNHPFTVGPSWSPYRPPELAPYQAVCDHVRERGGPEAGIIWSHPEITMRQGMPGVRLVTLPYLDDVEKTFGHNGLAGIYGDAFRAHLPGQAWDRMLAQYARGERRERPVIVGESDYHGGDRALPLIQTVVHIAAPGRRTILRALLDGNSYALYRQPEQALALDEATVATTQKTASLGETLSWDGHEPLVFRLRGHLDGPPPPPSAAARLTVVVDGREVASEMLALPQFDVTLPVSPEGADLHLHYVRFHIQGIGGQLIANPIFVQTEATP